MDDGALGKAKPELVKAVASDTPKIKRNVAFRLEKILCDFFSFWKPKKMIELQKIKILIQTKSNEV